MEYRRTANGPTRKHRRRPGKWEGRIPSFVVLERRTLTQRAAAEIRQRVLGGGVRSGGRLEPMRHLAADLGVSLPTIREAVAQLQGEGLIDVRHGVGCFVVRRPRMARSLKATTRRATRREIAEMRVVIDPAVAGVAAQRATPARIRDLLSAMWEREAARRGRDPEALIDADLRFHRCVAEAARGPIGIAAHRLATRILRPSLQAAAAEHYADDRLAQLHRSLAEAIGEGRTQRAVRAARLIALRETRPP